MYGWTYLSSVSQIEKFETQVKLKRGDCIVRLKCFCGDRKMQTHFTLLKSLTFKILLGTYTEFYLSIGPVSAKSCGFQKAAQYSLKLRPYGSLQTGPFPLADLFSYIMSHVIQQESLGNLESHVFCDNFSVPLPMSLNISTQLQSLGFS